MVEKTEENKSIFTNFMLIGLGGAMVGGTLHVLDATAYHQTVAIVGVVISVLGAYRSGA